MIGILNDEHQRLIFAGILSYSHLTCVNFDRKQVLEYYALKFWMRINCSLLLLLKCTRCHSINRPITLYV